MLTKCKYFEGFKKNEYDPGRRHMQGNLTEKEMQSTKRCWASEQSVTKSSFSPPARSNVYNFMGNVESVEKKGKSGSSHLSPFQLLLTCHCLQPLPLALPYEELIFSESQVAGPGGWGGAPLLCYGLSASEIFLALTQQFCF